MSLVIEDKKDYDLLIPPGRAQIKSISLKNLEKSTIKIFDGITHALIQDCKDCTIQIAPISTYCKIQKCSNCTLSLACSSLQVHSSSNLTLFLFSETDPQIKSSTGLKFAPYNIAFSGQEQCFIDSLLNAYKDKWSEIYDFNRSDIDPHYELLSPKHFFEENIVFSDLGDPVNPVPRHIHYGGSLKYEIIPYSKQHTFNVERRELPPSNTVVHSENDSRKYIPFNGPLCKIEPSLSTNFREDVQIKKIAIRYEYKHREGFRQQTTEVPALAKDIVDVTLVEVKKILDRYHDRKMEFEFGLLLSIIGCLIVALQMQVLRMSSEWSMIAWVFVMVILAFTEGSIFAVVFVRNCMVKKEYLGIVQGYILKKREEFSVYDAEIIGNLECLEVYMHNVK